MPKRIAVFQYDWPLQSYTRDLLVKLREEGHEVTFFAYQVFEVQLVDVSPLSDLGIEELYFQDTGTRIQHVEDRLGSIWGRAFRHIFWRFLVGTLKWLWKLPVHLIDKLVLFQSLLSVRKRAPFDYYIGMEKEGLIWASLLARKTRVPVIYYSLELYLEDLLHLPEYAKYASLRKAELKCHQRAVATIVQDRFRAEALFRANNTRNLWIPLPVSVRGLPVYRKSGYLCRKFGIPADKTILLYFGLFLQVRFCEEIIEAVNDMDGSCVAVFHGYGDPEYVALLQSKAKPGRVYFSLDLVEESELSEILSSAHIGFALYESRYLNDRFTALSSQKIALFARHGLPFVAMKNESYEDLERQVPCCALVDDVSSLPQALSLVVSHYQQYRAASFEAYRRFYHFDQAFAPLGTFLKSGSIQ